MSEESNDNGTSRKHLDAAERRRAVESARLAFDGIREEIEQINAFVDIIEEIGDAVIAVAYDDFDSEEQFDAGAEVLAARGDESDALRTGLRWLIEACSQGLPEYEEEKPPQRRAKAKKKAKSRE